MLKITSFIAMFVVIGLISRVAGADLFGSIVSFFDHNPIAIAYIAGALQIGFGLWTMK